MDLKEKRAKQGCPIMECCTTCNLDSWFIWHAWEIYPTESTWSLLKFIVSWKEFKLLPEYVGMPHPLSLLDHQHHPMCFDLHLVRPELITVVAVSCVTNTSLLALFHTSCPDEAHALSTLCAYPNSMRPTIIQLPWMLAEVVVDLVQLPLHRGMLPSPHCTFYLSP